MKFFFLLFKDLAIISSLKVKCYAFCLGTLVIIITIGAHHLHGNITSVSFPASVAVTFVATVSIATTTTMAVARVWTSI